MQVLRPVGWGLLLSFLAASAAWAADGPARGPDQAAQESLLESLDAIDQLTLADILDAPTEVASATSERASSAPGVITIITRAEILASGARDLVDVLQQVPGFAFAQDTQGVVGIGLRGLWGEEGKVLVLVDGHELNEPLYNAVPFGNEVPLDLVEKIEVIRGSGSPVYGGHAELAVVNVVLRQADNLQGLAAAGRVGSMDGSLTRRQLTISWAEKLALAGGLSLSAGASLGKGVRSVSTQSDFAGASYPMKDASALDPRFLTVRAAWRDLRVSYLHQDYRMLDRTGYSEILSQPAPVRFLGHYLSAEWTGAPSPTLSVTPRYRFKTQTPWNLTGDDPELFYDRSVARHTGDVVVRWAPLGWLSAVAGVEAAAYRAEVNDPAGGEFPEGRVFECTTAAAFANVAAATPIVDVNAGARFDWHSRVHGALAPRLALTRQLGDLRLKLLYAEDYRFPGIENLALSPSIEAEHMRGYELEVGYLFAPELHARLNVFATSISKPILYWYDEATNLEAYLNREGTGTAGAELEVRFKHRHGWVTAAWSFYDAGPWAQPEDFAVPGDAHSLLGFARHKVSATASLDLGSGFSVAPSLLFFSARSSLVPDPDGALVRRDAPSTWLVDASLSYRGPALGGVSLSLGAHNLLGERFDFLQPYTGGKPPLRAFDREVTLRVGYDG